MIDWVRDWDFWRTVAEFIGLMAAGAAASFAWVRRRDNGLSEQVKEGDEALLRGFKEFQHSNKSRFDRVHQRLDEVGEKIGLHNSRLTQVEEKVLHLPSHDDLSKIHRQLSQMEAKVAESLAMNRQTNELLTTINAYLIQREDRK